MPPTTKRRSPGASATPEREIERYGLFDYLIVNDDLDDAKTRLRSIVLAEQSRRWRKAVAAEELLARARSGAYRSRRGACVCALGVALLLAHAIAPGYGVKARADAPLGVGGKPLDASRPLLLAVDADDDDEDGVIDGKQADHVPTDELIEVVIPEAEGGATLTPLGGLRLIRYGQCCSSR